MDTQNKLDQLAELYAQRDLLKIDYSQKRDDAIPEEVEAALADIDIEYMPKIETIDTKIVILETEVKDEVKAGEKSVKGQFIHAVFAKGRVTWDSKQLDGLMIAVPELSQARKEGEPSVSLRKI